MKKLAYLLVTASVACCAQSAFAQDAGATDSQPAAAEQGSEAGLGDIVVTATKRSETSQRAPAAITAVNSETLVSRGLTSLGSVEKVVPAAKFAIENNETQIFIRGVGSSVGNPNIPESVATQVNGVFLPRYGTGAALFDVEQIEVLPGPQGTLYGRSAIGGVININTRRPGKDLGFEASLDKANYDATRINAGVDLPLSDTVSVRGAALFDKHDGYANNGTNNQNALAGRLSLLAKPTEDLTIFLWGGYYRAKFKPSPLQYAPFPSQGAYYFPATDVGTAFVYPPNGLPNDIGRSRFRSWQFGGQIDLDLGGVTVSYIPGYLYGRDQSTRSIVGFIQINDISYKQLSNEVRFSSNSDGKLKWLIGLSQFHQSSPFFYTFGPNFGGADMVVKTNALAAYGEATYSVTDGVRLTAGTRVSWDKLAAENPQAFFPIFNPVTFNFDRGIIPYTYSESWKRFNWKVGVEADIAPQSMLYANVQTGFNPGTFQVSAPVQGGKIDPQKMLGFTAGSKNRFLDNRLQVNLELFYYRYRDQIVQAYDVGTGATQLFNAPRSRMYGAQLDTVFAITPNTRINFSAGTLNAKLTKFVANVYGGILDLGGFILPDSPKLTASAGLEQTFPLASGAAIKFRADSAYNSGYWDTFGHQPDLRQDRYTKTDVSLTYITPNENFEVSVWGRNLENEATHAAAGVTGRPFPQAGALYVEPPRTYGATVRAKL